MSKKSTKPAAKKVAPAVLKVGTNPLKLPWPTAPDGTFQELREVTHTIHNIRGDAHKHALFKKYIDILVAHEQETYYACVAARKKAKEAAEAAALAAREAEGARKEAEKQAIRDEIKRLEDEVANL